MLQAIIPDIIPAGLLNIMEVFHNVSHNGCLDSAIFVNSIII